MLDHSPEKAALVVRVMRQQSEEDRIDLTRTLGIMRRLVATASLANADKNYAWADELTVEVELAVTRCELELEHLTQDFENTALAVRSLREGRVAK